ncbi:MAG TPA: transglycosylase SLT domain-containing protein, partial [Acidimicrobiales bacterium]|nr:transglycosylase SLT domain-containing protein [Acidimicrobiales bacterium]
APLTVTVHLGDTLSSIASRNHTTVAALVAANGIKDPNKIVAGTVLRLPASTMALASYSAPLPSAGSGGAGPSNPGQLPSVLRSHAERMALFPAFKQAAAANGVPAPLLEAMCWWESGWQAGIVSPTGAVGVCQLEPATTQFVETTLLHTTLDPHVAAQNVRLGAAYLAYLLGQTHGDQQLALAGYYAGLSSVLHHGMGPATKNYVAGIFAYAKLFAAAG